LIGLIEGIDELVAAASYEYPRPKLDHRRWKGGL
jgi:hypothetical protein